MHAHSPTLYPAPAGLAILEEDHQLLVRCAGEDRHAFTALFQRHRDGLQGFLFRKLRSHEDAEDDPPVPLGEDAHMRVDYRGRLLTCCSISSAARITREFAS